MNTPTATPTIRSRSARAAAALYVALAASTLGLASPATAQRAKHPTHSYVLVHGATGGGWDWRAVDSMLTRRGFPVLRVTLTGLGERVHLASPDITLETHIQDVVNTILWENLRDVILVGHSYGGIIITGVADRIPERLHRLVYIDAILPDSGETLIAWADSTGAAYIRDAMRNGFFVPGWVSDTTTIPRDVRQSARTFTDPLHLVNPARTKVPGTYVLTYEPDKLPDSFQKFADRAAARGMSVIRLQADHVPERSARAPLVRILSGVP